MWGRMRFEPVVRDFLEGFRRVERVFNVISLWMAMASGCLFTLIAIYMTVDVTSRRFGGPFTGVSDEVSGYALAMGMTWAMARALAGGNHVRVDVLLPWLPPKLREVLDIVAIALLGIFAGALSEATWGLAGTSYSMDAKAVAMIQTPLVIPQALMAFGFTTLTIQAVLMVAAGIAQFVRNLVKADAAVNLGGEGR